MENKLEKFSRLVVGRQDNPSITSTNQKIDVDTNREDMMALFLKSTLGVFPFGSSIAEIVTSVIPNQKFERLKDFVEILNYKFENAERKIEEQELKTEEFTDLLEDALGQASRALSKERLDYIASLLKNSLTDEELEHIENKKLLSLLGELTDAEIIWLRSFLHFPHMSEEFSDTHEKILSIKPLYQDCSKSAEYKQAIQKSYKEKIIQLGLLREIYEKVGRDEAPKIDENTGKIKVSHYEVSTLGYSLLEIMDVYKKEY